MVSACGHFGIGLLLAEQSQWFARECTTRVMILDSGSMVFQGDWAAFGASTQLVGCHLAVWAGCRLLIGGRIMQDGTQGIHRAAAILQRITHSSEKLPATLRSISEDFDPPRSSAHRVLKSLVDTRIASYNARRRRYEIRILCCETGLAVTDQVLDVARLHPVIARIAAWAAIMRGEVDRLGNPAEAPLVKARRSGAINPAPRQWRVPDGRRKLLAASSVQNAVSPVACR